MIIKEIDSGAITDQLAALSVFLLGRSDDENATKKISVEAFLNLAADMGVSLTRKKLVDLSQQAPLNQIISNIEDTDVIFKGGKTEVPDMPVDKARETVKKMAKRAAKIK